MNAIDRVPISFSNALMAMGRRFDLPYSVELWTTPIPRSRS
jgi:hypothetical protein